MSKRNLKCFLVNDKLRIISTLKSGKSRNEISKEFEALKSILCQILNNNEKIQFQCMEGYGKFRRFHAPEYPELEKCLATLLQPEHYYCWTLIKQMAKYLAENMDANILL